ncbi:alpha/beta fold hydrolase [Microbacterium sp. PMB16]|uniref:alpha/beta fold hydrolase n=1 Tax=Microbacterium sp. PMB16 TaxID=3120157 RepID=UPI003F4C1BB2
MVRAHEVERLYIHGGGRRGADAWPHVADPAARFLSFSPDSTIAEQMSGLVEEVGDRRVLMFAHSIGAVPAVLAAHHLDVAGLVLIEPALYDIARGVADVERHIGIVTEARALAASGDLRGFWAVLRPLMFGGPFEMARWDEERPVAERWAVTNLPWGHAVRERMLDDIPTLVVTGGWNGEYEAIARILVARGAQHVVLPGAEHRPQDLPGFSAAVEAFEHSLPR